VEYGVDYGSDILATGEARIVREQNPDTKIAFGNPEALSPTSEGKTKLYWSEIFENNPNILQPGENAEEITIIANFPKSRPFINYAKTKYTQIDEQNKTPYKFAYNADYETTRGELFFSDNEIAEAEKLIGDLEAPIIFIDPIAGIENKGWLPERWNNLVEQSSYNFVQLLYNNQPTALNGVTQIDPKTFRLACAILKVCSGKSILLTTDSNLHHAAAALNMPTIVLWSHYSHPDNLGYEEHINIRWDAAGTPCGLRDSCIQCKHSMEMIKVEDVLLAIDMTIKELR